MPAKIISSKKMSKSSTFHNIGNNELLFAIDEKDNDCNPKNKFSNIILNHLNKFRITENDRNSCNIPKQSKKTKNQNSSSNFKIFQQKYDVNAPSTSSKNLNCDCTINSDETENKKVTNVEPHKMRYSISEAFLFQKIFRKDNNCDGTCSKKNFCEANSLKKSTSAYDDILKCNKMNETLTQLENVSENDNVSHSHNMECKSCVSASEQYLSTLHHEPKSKDIEDNDIRLNRRGLPLNTTFSTWLNLFLSRKKNRFDRSSRNTLTANGLTPMRTSVSLCKLSFNF